MLTKASYKGRSFTEQMAEMAPRTPGAYLLTAYSAVPIADSIRGYYDTIGQAVRIFTMCMQTQLALAISCEEKPALLEKLRGLGLCFHLLNPSV